MLDPQDRLRHLVEHLNDAVYTVDITTNTFTSLNPAAGLLTGYTQDELIGVSITSIIDPESLGIVRKMITQKMKKDTPTVYEVELIHKDGRRIPVEISSRMVYKEGKPLEILGIARDITERKLAERQKEIFFSLITHEIKNPLTSISMYTQLLQKSAEKRKDDKELQMLGIIKGQVVAISQLMSDFVEVNQLQLKKFSITKKPFDLNETITEVMRLFNQKSTGHILQKKGKTTSLVNGDKQRISQVLTNLISNAMKYSKKGTKVIITVKQEKQFVTISVQDFGLGIAKSHQKAVFDLFYRIQVGKHSIIKGHGLGLYICREIVNGHNGKIWVESDGEGGGSTFYFSIPLS